METTHRKAGRPPKAVPGERFTVMLPVDLAAKIREIANAENASYSSLTQKLIQKGLEQ